MVACISVSSVCMQCGLRDVPCALLEILLSPSIHTHRGQELRPGKGDWVLRITRVLGWGSYGKAYKVCHMPANSALASKPDHLSLSITSCPLAGASLSALIVAYLLSLLPQATRHTLSTDGTREPSSLSMALKISLEALPTDPMDIDDR